MNVRPELAWFDHPDDRSREKLDQMFGVGIGLLPVTTRVFEFWQPELLFAQPITEEEHGLLDEYGLELQPWDDLKYA